jgi:cobalt-zinc-cadmium efflux system outer membrane protein
MDCYCLFYSKNLIAVNYHIYIKILYLWLIVLISPVHGYTQSDTPRTQVSLTYEQAKARMLKENLQLLAAHYDLDIAQAEALQAKLWNNPYLIWNQGLYSVEKNDYFNAQRQSLIQVEQVFSIAGKHTHTVKLAKINVELNKLIVQDVLRSLLLEFSNSYASLNAFQQQNALYGEVLEKFGQLINASQQQLRTGGIAGNEVVRLKSEFTAIQAQALRNRNEIEETMSGLRILLHLPADTYIETTERVSLIDSVQSLPAIITSALDSRPDYKLSMRSMDYEARNLRLQKSMSVPDLKLAYQPQDRGSNYVRPYVGFNIEMPLPVFDRNQGNIQGAKIKVKQSQVNNRQQEAIVTNETTSAYYQLVNTQKGLDNYSPQFIEQLEELNTNANTNYNKRNISILEYIDQQRIYIQTKIQQIELKDQYNQSVNRLNFSVGKEIL